jgi:hypothetical protein
MSLFSINQVYSVSCRLSLQLVTFLAAALDSYVFCLFWLLFIDTGRPGWGD